MKKPSRAKLIDRALLRRWPLPKPPEHADKSSKGDVLIVGGSREIPGAVLLSAEAALRVGAGRVRIATARSAATALAVAFPEARVIGLPESKKGELLARSAAALESEVARSDAVVLGPGMFDHALPGALLRRAVKAGHEPALLLDAAGLRALGSRQRPSLGSLAGLIVTPHAGEMAELQGCKVEEVHRSPFELALDAAQRWGVTVVLKGQRTFVVDPDGTAYVNEAGNSGLATAGSGDSLSGIIAGLAARGATPIQAAAWGVHLHALAGEALAKKRGPLGYLARELSTELPPLLRTLG